MENKFALGLKVRSNYSSEIEPRGPLELVIALATTSAGCSMANAIARAIAAGGIAIFSIRSTIWAFTAGFVMEFVRFVWTNPGETLVTPAYRRLPVARSR